jgi:hypothetical protein
MIWKFCVNEVPRGEGPVSIKGFPFGSRKVVNAVHDETGLILRKTILLHEIVDPSIPIIIGEEDPPDPPRNQGPGF